MSRRSRLGQGLENVGTPPAASAAFLPERWVCARPRPLFRKVAESSLYRIALDIPDNPVFFVPISYPPIKIIPCPKASPRTLEHPIRLTCRCSLDTAHYARQ